MKKNIIFSLLSIAALAMVTITFTACGGDDNDDITGGDTSVGVHRVDIQFSSSAVHSSVGTYIYGMKAGSSMSNIITSNLYENGQQLPLDATTHLWECNAIRDISVKTESGCVGIMASVILMAKWGVSATPEDITITCVGYVNDKRMYTKVYTLPAGKKTISISFSTSEGGTSGYVIDNEIVE